MNACTKEVFVTHPTQRPYPPALLLPFSAQVYGLLTSPPHPRSSVFKPATAHPQVIIEASETTDLTAQFKGMDMKAVLLNASCHSFVKVCHAWGCFRERGRSGGPPSCSCLGNSGAGVDGAPHVQL